MRGRSLALLFILASLAASLAPAGSAAAAVGDLAYRGCVGSQTIPDCAPVPGAMLDGASSVAVGPAGDAVYVASLDAAAFSVFARDGAGSLSFRDCASSAALAPCDDLEGIPLQRAVGVAVSPDGGSAYTLGSLVDTVLGFASGPAGLGPGRCLSSAASAATLGCLPQPNQPMREPGDLAISPDGTSLYVVSRPNNSIAHFTRAQDGQLAFGGCDAGAPVNGCVDLPAEPLLLPQQAVVTPDGRFVYVSGRLSDSIVRLARQPGGQLAFDGCLTDTAGNGTGCAVLPGQVLDGAQGLVVSPDGRFLYVTGFNDDTVVQFAIDAAGGLDFVSCLIAGDPAEGCDGVPGSSLSFPRSIAISPDGRSLYVVGEKDPTLAHLARDPGTGRLTFASCSIGAPVPGNTCVDLPGEPLRSLQEVAVSPDGTSVYGADLQADSIVVFSRSLTDQPPTPEQPGEPGQPGPGQPDPDRPRPHRPGPDRPGPDQSGPPARCAGRAATIVGTPRADVLRGTPRRDVIAALGGADTIRGRGGADLICGGAGRDAIFGGGGRDRILGEAGVDRCLDGPGRDRVKCERGRGRRG